MELHPDGDGVADGVHEVEDAGGLALGNAAAEVLEGLHAELVGLLHVRAAFGRGVIEDELVLMGVFEAEGDVAAEAGDELIEGREAAISISSRRSMRVSKVSEQMAATISVLFLK